MEVIRGKIIQKGMITAMTDEEFYSTLVVALVHKLGGQVEITDETLQEIQGKVVTHGGSDENEDVAILTLKDAKDTGVDNE